MAEATLFRVTDEERRMAIELSEEKYRMYVEDERSEARREGRTAGLAEGHAKGLADGVKQTAKILKQLGDSVQKIIQVTGLSKEEIEQL